MMPLSRSTLHDEASFGYLTALTRLEEEIRSAVTLQELQFLSVNETRRLVPYRQAYLLSADDARGKGYHVVCASSVATVERDAPMIRWLEQAGRALKKQYPDATARVITENTCPESCRSGWREFVESYVCWCPLKHPDDTVLGAWWLEREFPWQQDDMPIVQRIAGSYAYAWKALSNPARRWASLDHTPSGWMLTAAVAVALCLPVRISTMAPVKVMAKDPLLISAPMDGVIADVSVPPNTVVHPGTLLFRYDDTTVRNQYEVAAKELALAQTEHAQAIQAGFSDPQRKAEVPLKDAEIELRETELDYAKELVSQIEVHAPQAGLLLYTDRADWIGKPVVVGERIMEIADPQRIELRIDLPVKDALLLAEGAEVLAFFDALPLDSFPATVTRASYHAEVLPGDLLAYRLTAELSHLAPPIRIGWQGSAKIYGRRGPLAFLLFRRPVTALRQWLGV
jgi:hypothetical protein